MANATKTTRSTTQKSSAAKAGEAVTETVKAEAETAEAFQARMAATVKGCASNTQKAKPQRKMLRRIAKMHKHPGTGLGIKRWHLYREGMTLQEAKETAGLTPLDITFWEKNELVEMADCTDAEYEAAVKAWEATRKPKEDAKSTEAKAA